MKSQKKYSPKKLIVSLLFSVVIVCLTSAQYGKLYDFTLDKTLQRPWLSDFVTDGTYLYTLTSNGGANNKGVLFRVKPDGTGYQTLMKFDSINGKWPGGSVIISGNVLYGMTWYGGSKDGGVIFKINTDGTGYQKLLDFDGSNKGLRPTSKLTLSGSILYGSTSWGGTANDGVIFKINTDGSGYQKLLDFNGTNGLQPFGNLILIGSTLYGTTNLGGKYNNGVIFKIGTNGSGFSKLFEFNGTNGKRPDNLTLSGSVLYGMTEEGGANSKGVIYKINTDGTGFKKILDFNGTNNGRTPIGTLTISGNVLYGLTQYGGSNDLGKAFKINTDGTGYQTLINFDNVNNASYPYGAFLMIGSTLYATATCGSYGNAGTLFKINTDGTNFRIIRHCFLPVYGGRPANQLVTDNVAIYGVTQHGGINDKGAIFKINQDGTGIQNVFNFNGDVNGHTPTSIVISGSTFYGMTNKGGTNDLGTIYKVNTDGTGFRKLLDFDGTTKGATPSGSSLTISGTILYGTTQTGGTNNVGVLFKMNTDGSGFKKLLDFDGTNSGSNPMSAPILSGSVLYCASYLGGTNSHGVLFKINTDGSGFQKLYNFTVASGPLTLVGSTLYGMAQSGGTNSMGFIFKINSDGTGFQDLSDFNGTSKGSNPPYAALTYIGSSLYGVTGSGGANNTGVLFKFDPNGNTFQKLVDFKSKPGSNPITSPLYLNAALYGAAYFGVNSNVCNIADTIGFIYKVTVSVVDLQIKTTGGTLTCANPRINVNVTSNIAGVTYAWSGPNGFSSTIQNPEVSVPGNYIVTVTSGGISKTDTAKVDQNNTIPGASASVSDTLTCDITSVTLSAFSPTQGVTYKWSGPQIFTSTEQNPVTANPGTYTVTVTNPVNKCSSSASIDVIRDVSTALGVAISVSGTINCVNANISLKGSSATSGVSYNWSGPGNFTSSGQVIVVGTPGNYILHVTKPDNECVISTDVTVVLDTITPKDVVAEASGILSCTKSSVVLTGRSSVSGATYKWVGPGLSSTEANPSVATPGTYYLTVTDPTNECRSTASVNVLKDLTPPQGISTSVSDVLTCVNLNVTISVSSSTQGVAYSWKGPKSFSSNERTPKVSNPGTFLVTITNPYNNCSVTDSIKVQQNIMLPEGVSASVSGILTCKSKVSVKGASVTAGVTYSWTGPNGYTSTLQNPPVNTAGKYSLTVTNPTNECTSTTFVDVNENKTPPADVKAEVSGDLNCVDAFVILTGSSSTIGASYSWTGPEDFMSDESVTNATKMGAYKLFVTHPTNYCKDSVSISVALDTISPVSYIIPPSGSPVALTDETLTAQEVSNVNYLWGLSSSNVNWSIVSGDDTQKMTYHAGDLGSTATFSLRVTSKQNGCSRTSQIALSSVSKKSAPFADTEGLTKDFLISVYPNPFTDKACIEFTPKQSDRVTIELYPTNGNLPSVLFDGNVEALQPYKITLDGTNMTAGIYCFVIKTRSGKKVYSNKISLIK